MRWLMYFPGEHRVQLGEILDSMDRGERPPVSGDEARRILEFAASLYKSANTGKPVQRGEIVPGDPYYTAMNGAAVAQRHERSTAAVGVGVIRPPSSRLRRSGSSTTNCARMRSRGRWASFRRTASTPVVLHPRVGLPARRAG